MGNLELPPQVPTTRSALLRAIGRLLMRLGGWQVAGTFPSEAKFVLLIAPHTSNWDFFVAAAAKLALGLDASWIAKDSIFQWPLTPILRNLGGFPVDRKNPHGVVHHVIDEFNARENMVFGLTPEGTRKRVEHWRSGYWHVAEGAHVPMVPVGLDYGSRTVVIGPAVMPSASMEDDEKRLRAFFAGMRPRRPENYYA